MTRRVSEPAMFLAEAAPLPPPEVVGAGSDPGCTGFGSKVPDEELKPLASCAKPTAGGSARKTEYTFFKKVSPTIHIAPKPPSLRAPASKIAPAHMSEVTVPTFMSTGLIFQSVPPKDMETVILVLQGNAYKPV